MANKDLRNWLEDVESIGELRTITGVEHREEIGGLVDIFQRKMGNPAVMFDEVPGFPKGHRVIANILTSVPRINVALGLDPEASEMDLIRWWRDYMGDAPTHAPREVNGGPLLDNVSEGAAVDITTIPTPKWHEHDGGHFIGTGCMVVMKDPDTGWVNFGCYRVQSHEPALATVMMSPGKHGRLIMEKYHKRGRSLPGRRGGRDAPGVLHDRGAGDPLRQERVRRGRRADAGADRSRQHAEDRAPGAGRGRDRVRGLHPRRRQGAGRPARRVDRLLRGAASARSRRSGSRPSCTGTTRC